MSPHIFFMLSIFFVFHTISEFARLSLQNRYKFNGDYQYCIETSVVVCMCLDGTPMAISSYLCQDIQILIL